MSVELKYVKADAAAFACRHWHYTGTVPVGKQVKIGVWENGRFIGVVCYGTGAAPQLHTRFHVGKFEVCELTRIALMQHRVPVSRLIAISLRMLLKINPGLRVCVSFADPEQGHVGGVYQASGWTYLGMTDPCKIYRIGQKRYHNRTVTGLNFGNPKIEIGDNPHSTISPGKHRYAQAFTKVDRAMLDLMAQPYPKRTKPSIEALGYQLREGGVIPTRALHSEAERV